MFYTDALILSRVMSKNTRETSVIYKVEYENVVQ